MVCERLKKAKKVLDEAGLFDKCSFEKDGAIDFIWLESKLDETMYEKFSLVDKVITKSGGNIAVYKQIINHFDNRLLFCLVEYQDLPTCNFYKFRVRQPVTHIINSCYEEITAFYPPVDRIIGSNTLVFTEFNSDKDYIKMIASKNKDKILNMETIDDELHVTLEPGGAKCA